jgi:SSS family solute:Na+ symporter
MTLLIFIITLGITLCAGVLSKRLVKSSKDFLLGGGKLNTIGFTSMLMGAIIGGASTVGTSQMAYQRGIGAIWFTAGLSISSVLLYFFYGKLLEKRQYVTVVQIVGDHFGKRARKAASLILCLGMLIHINGQVLAAVSIFNTLLVLKIQLATLVVCGLVAAYVIFGGFWGGTVVGGIKTVLLYGTSLVCGAFLIFKYGFIREAVTAFAFDPWFNVFSEGLITDLSLPVSTVLGVLSTQIYFQTVMSVKNKQTLRRGTLLTAFLILPVGIVCTMIGMYMRLHYPDIIPRDAFILFVMNHTNPLVAGLSIASVLISSVATGAGLTLGITTVISKDVLLTEEKGVSDAKLLKKLRMIIAAITGLVYFIVIFNANSLILSWGFLSMVFRAAPIFIPVVLALYFKEIICGPRGMGYVLVGPVLSLIWIVAGLDKVSSIYVGIAGGLVYSLGVYKIYMLKRNQSESPKNQESTR